MGPVTECYRCDRAPCSTWNGRPVCGDCLDYYREGAAPFPDESAGSESIASGGSDRHDENSAPAAGSREAATDPPTGLTNPTPDASSSPVPVPVVNEYEGVQSEVERIARQLHGQHQDEPVWGKLDGHKRDDYHLFAARVLQCPSVAAAFEAQAKLEAAAEAGSLERLLGQRDALAARLAEAVGLLREGEDFHWDDGPDDAHDSYAARVRRFLEDGEGS